MIIIIVNAILTDNTLEGFDKLNYWEKKNH